MISVLESCFDPSPWPRPSFAPIYPQALTIGSAAINGTALVVLFGDGHRSELDLSRVRAEVQDQATA